MKRLVLFLSLLFSFSHSSTKSLASQDALNCLRGASAQDAQLLLNLVYWSYLRSATTLVAQNVLLDNFKQSWMLWQNFASTRRNPRTALPYPEIKQQQIDSIIANIAAQTHAQVNATYIQALGYTIEQNSIITSQPIKRYIETIRSEARTAVAQALVSSLVDLEEALQNVQNIMESIHSKKFIHNMRTLADKVKEAEKNFINDGIDYLMNGLALQSFAQFDKKYLASSNQFFNLLVHSQDMYSQVWQQLETSRAAYYQEIYTTLYAAMIELNFPSSSFLHIVNEQGILPVDQQKYPLPALLL